MKKPELTLALLTLLIIIGAAAASLAGLSGFSGDPGPQVESLRGESYRLDGRGIYRNDTVSYAAQARGQDLITLTVGIPLLLIGLFFSRRGSLRGSLLLAGTLGYFLYTYTSYVFLVSFNSLFLLYTFLFSASLFAFILAFTNIDAPFLEKRLSPRFPRRFLGFFQIILGVLLLLMWLGRIAPSMKGDIPPAGLEIYTTLVIQAMDLGIVVPAAFISGMLLLKRKPLGTVLSGVLLMKFFTMGLALDAMMIMMVRAGVTLSTAETAVFVTITAVGLLATGLMFFSVRKADSPDPHSPRKS